MVPTPQFQGASGQAQFQVGLLCSLLGTASQLDTLEHRRCRAAAGPGSRDACTRPRVAFPLGSGQHSLVDCH